MSAHHFKVSALELDFNDPGAAEFSPPWTSPLDPFPDGSPIDDLPSKETPLPSWPLQSVVVSDVNIEEEDRQACKSKNDEIAVELLPSTIAEPASGPSHAIDSSPPLAELLQSDTSSPSMKSTVGSGQTVVSLRSALQSIPDNELKLLVREKPDPMTSPPNGAARPSLLSPLAMETSSQLPEHEKFVAPVSVRLKCKPLASSGRTSESRTDFSSFIHPVDPAGEEHVKTLGHLMSFSEGFPSNEFRSTLPVDSSEAKHAYPRREDTNPMHGFNPESRLLRRFGPRPRSGISRRKISFEGHHSHHFHEPEPARSEIQTDFLLDQINRLRRVNEGLVATAKAQEKQLDLLYSALNSAKAISAESSQRELASRNLLEDVLTSMEKFILEPRSNEKVSDSNAEEPLQTGAEASKSNVVIPEQFIHDDVPSTSDEQLLKDRIGRIFESHRSLHSELERKRKECLSLKEGNHSLSRELNKAQVDKAQAIQGLDEAERAVGSLREEKQELLVSFGKLKDDHNALRADLTDVQIRLATAEDENKKLQKQLDGLCRNAKSLLSDLHETQAQLETSEQEKQILERQLDYTRFRLIQARRQMGSLDHLTRFQLEVRQNWLYGPVRRGRYTPKERPNLKIVEQVNLLNHDIFDLSLAITRELERTEAKSEGSDQAITMLGEWFETMLQGQAVQSGAPSQERLGKALQVYMVTFCSAIIEASYPKRKTFSDLLIELSSQGFGSGRYCRIIPDATSSEKLQFRTWVREITDKLSTILLVGGLAIRPDSLPRISQNLFVAVNRAYDLRTALAERDICGNLELFVPAPGTELLWVLTEDAAVQLTDTDYENLTMQRRRIAGTTTIGLRVVQRTERMRDRTHDQQFDVVLYPKVVLTDDLTAAIPLQLSNFLTNDQ